MQAFTAAGALSTSAFRLLIFIKCATLHFLLPQVKGWPHDQTSPPLKPGSGASQEPLGDSRTSFIHIKKKEQRVPKQSQPPPAQQLLEQRPLVLTLGLQRQRPRQGQIPPQQTEHVQVRRHTVILVLRSFCCHVTVVCGSHRERDSANRSDTDSRARRRSRSYSPIRKRRRDSPSFMEARRITRYFTFTLQNQNAVVVFLVVYFPAVMSLCTVYSLISFLSANKRPRHTF